MIKTHIFSMNKPTTPSQQCRVYEYTVHLGL